MWLIHAFGDSWLIDDSNFYVNSDAMVDLAISSNGLSWDVSLVHGLFASYDAHRILSIPISNGKPEGKLIWHFSKSGIYDVWSGYRLAVAKYTSINNLAVSVCWQQSWNLDLPPKIKDFISSVLRDSCPVNIFGNNSAPLVVRILAILWSIWYALNKAVWQQISTPSQDTVRMADNFLQAWRYTPNPLSDQSHEIICRLLIDGLVRRIAF
ncbi:hypothetical protein V6Z11_1Z016900 [Gossypium hirsutum]